MKRGFIAKGGLACGLSVMFILFTNAAPTVEGAGTRDTIFLATNGDDL